MRYCKNNLHAYMCIQLCIWYETSNIFVKYTFVPSRKVRSYYTVFALWCLYIDYFLSRDTAASPLFKLK